MTTNTQAIHDLLTRSVEEVIDGEHLRTRLENGTPLRVKFGIDPTSPHLHIGRMVPLLKLRDFQILGHKIILLVGNATGVIGDTSDKESERPMLERATVEENMRTYVSQVEKILDMDAVEVVYNADWLDALNFREIGELAGAFSVQEFIRRDNIKRRLDAGTRVSLREVLYPLMQGYDSVHLRADVEVGGTDQRFNMLAGRTLQAQYGQSPQDVVMTPLILGTDGRKMSSSWGNTINLTDDARTMFGKVMSIPDSLIVPYFMHCTRTPLEDVIAIERGMADETVHPRDAKLRLAETLVTLLHDADAAAAERIYFIETFSKKTVPTDAPSLSVAAGTPLVEALVEEGLATSKSDARRKIRQRGVRIDAEVVTDETLRIEAAQEGSILRVGKTNFRTIHINT